QHSGRSITKRSLVWTATHTKLGLLWRPVFNWLHGWRPPSHRLTSKSKASGWRLLMDTLWYFRQDHVAITQDQLAHVDAWPPDLDPLWRVRQQRICTKPCIALRSDEFNTA